MYLPRRDGRQEALRWSHPGGFQATPRSGSRSLDPVLVSVRSQWTGSLRPLGKNQGNSLPEQDREGQQRQEEDACPGTTAKFDAKNLLSQQARQQQCRDRQRQYGRQAERCSSRGAGQPNAL